MFQDRPTRWSLNTGVADTPLLIFDFHTEEERSEFANIVSEGRSLADAARRRQQVLLEELVATMRHDGLPDPPAYGELPLHGALIVDEDESIPELADYSR